MPTLSESGRLSVGQAIQRGNRANFTSRLAERHGLPIPLALEVADNRISLLKAMRQRGSHELIRVGPQKSPSPKLRTAALLVSAVLLVLLATTGAYLGSQALNRLQEDERAEAADRRQRIIRGTRVAKDDLGARSKSAAPTPRVF